MELNVFQNSENCFAVSRKVAEMLAEEDSNLISRLCLLLSRNRSTRLPTLLRSVDNEVINRIQIRARENADYELCASISDYAIDNPAIRLSVNVYMPSAEA